MMYLGRFKEQAEEAARWKDCEIAVYATAATNVMKDVSMLNQIERLFRSQAEGSDDIKCPTDFDVIKSKNKEDIMHELSQKMCRCVKTFGRGELNLFGPVEDNKYCIICDNIDFSEELEITAEEFLEYQHDPRHECYGENIAEFLSMEPADPGALEEYKADINQADVAINTGNDYSTVFMYARNNYWNNLFTTPVGMIVGGIVGLVGIPFTGGGSFLILGGSAALAVGGGVIGYQLGSGKNADWDPAIILLPHEAVELNKLGCTYLPASQDG